ncbi:hypothetical protein PMI06_008666 [Burkholderia sp. BT03]|jgi:hypothetical protein|nr:hypothetical protein PMI06_008666 [Burkholderia sp. BT03]
MKRFEFDSLYCFATVPDEILRDKATTEALTSQVDADRHPSQPKRPSEAHLGPGPTAIANECNDRNVATCASGAAAVLSLKPAAQSAPARRRGSGVYCFEKLEACCFRRKAVAPATKSPFHCPLRAPDDVPLHREIATSCDSHPPKIEASWDLTCNGQGALKLPGTTAS